MAMEARCCTFFFPNYSKNKSAEDTLVPPQRGKRFIFFILFVHAAARGGTCAFTLNVASQHAHQKQQTRQQAFDLDIESTDGPPASCWARPVNVDDGLEDQGDARCREREVARGVLRSSPIPEKRPIFCHQRGMKIFCRLFSTQQRPNVNTINTVTRG